MGFRSKGFHTYEIKYSQNFFKSEDTAKEIVDLTNLNQDDTVIEIGSGRGALTKFIVAKCENLIAIEKDTSLYNKLKNDFKDIKNLKIINHDFLEYFLPESNNYKVIGNIPFALTSQILKKVLENKNKPSDVYFILQKEAAIRFLGSDYKNNHENLFSLRFKPFYQAEITKNLNRNDFIPRPAVDAVMLHIQKRPVQLINESEIEDYFDFISFCITTWRINLRAILKRLFSNKQIKFIQENLYLNLDSKPTEVNFYQWLELFKVYKQHSSEKNKLKVKGSFRDLELKQGKLIKRARTNAHLV
jgi:23S rRNA (adenine-N6)-dimethyltransferase